MQKEESKKILFVINPASGGENKIDWEQTIRDYFNELPHHPAFYLLRGGDDDAPSIRKYIQSIQPQTVVAVGGDGTIKLVAEIIIHTDMALGILPAGSANGLAKELGIPAAPVPALDIIVNGNTKAIDAIKINEAEMCLHLSDMGLNALLVKTFENSQERGMWGYGKAILKIFWKRTRINVTLHTDEQTINRHAYMVVIANASKYGTGATINPGSQIDDGCFEAVVVRKLSLYALLKMLISHKGFDSNVIEIIKTNNLHITARHKTYFQVDGEYRGRLRDIKAQIMHKVLWVKVPATAEPGAGLA